MKIMKPIMKNNLLVHSIYIVFFVCFFPFNAFANPPDMPTGSEPTNTQGSQIQTVEQHPSEWIEPYPKKFRITSYPSQASLDMGRALPSMHVRNVKHCKRIDPQHHVGVSDYECIAEDCANNLFSRKPFLRNIEQGYQIAMFFCEDDTDANSSSESIPSEYWHLGPNDELVTRFNEKMHCLGTAVRQNNEGREDWGFSGSLRMHKQLCKAALINLSPL